MRSDSITSIFAFAVLMSQNLGWKFLSAQSEMSAELIITTIIVIEISYICIVIYNCISWQEMYTI